MARRLIIDCGAAETRAALLDGGEARGFWFGPARGDESLPRPPQAGDVHVGRVRAASKALGGAFVDIGADQDAFLPAKAPPTEGALLTFVVRRPPLGAKGAVLAIAGEAPKGAEPGIAQEPTDAALAAARHFGFASPVELFLNDGDATRLLAASHDARFDPRAISEFAFDDAIAQSLEPIVTIAAGARLIFAETDAGAMIDVDSAAASGASARPVNDAVNRAALQDLTGELLRRAIGGRIIVDFMPPSGAAARTALQAGLEAALSALEGARAGRLQRDGLFDLTLPRRSASLLAQATEEAGDDWPIKGRRYTLDWEAKAAVRRLETALSARPSSRPKLIVGRAIAAYLADERPQWSNRLAQRHGARFEISLVDQMEPRAHDLVE